MHRDGGTMFFLIGSRTTHRVLGRIPSPCPRCARVAPFTFVRSARWFTFFFIPCIPLGTSTLAVCAACKFQQSVTNEWADQTLRALPQLPRR